jgi:hypothetical protein
MKDRWWMQTVPHTKHGLVIGAGTSDVPRVPEFFVWRVTQTWFVRHDDYPRLDPTCTLVSRMGSRVWTSFPLAIESYARFVASITLCHDGPQLSYFLRYNPGMFLGSSQHGVEPVVEWYVTGLLTGPKWWVPGWLARLLERAR